MGEMLEGGREDLPKWSMGGVGTVGRGSRMWLNSNQETECGGWETAPGRTGGKGKPEPSVKDCVLSRLHFFLWTARGLELEESQDQISFHESNSCKNR